MQHLPFESVSDTTILVVILTHPVFYAATLRKFLLLQCHYRNFLHYMLIEATVQTTNELTLKNLIKDVTLSRADGHVIIPHP